MPDDPLAPRPDRDPRASDLRRFLAAAALAKAGTQIGALALPLVAVLTLDASPAQVGVLGGLGTAAFAVIGLPAGVWLDRMRRRRVMIAADLARGLLLASVPVAWLGGWLTFAHLCVVMALSGVGTVFFDIAAQSHLPHLAGGERLLAANSRLAVIDSTGRVAAPAVGGWLVHAVGPPLAVALNSLGYLWSAAWLRSVRGPEPPPGASSGRRLVAEIKDGLRFVHRQPVLRAAALAGGMTNLAVAATLTMLPLVLTRELRLAGTALGLYLAAGGTGSLLGAATAGPLARWLGEGRSVWLLGLCATPAALLVPTAGAGVPLWLSAAGWAVTAYRIGYDNVVLVSFRQAATPDRLLGRVNATMRVLLTGAVTAGAFGSGLLGEVLTPRAALWAGAAVLALTWLPVFASPLRRARTLQDVDEPVPVPDPAS